MAKYAIVHDEPTITDFRKKSKWAEKGRDEKYKREWVFDSRKEPYSKIGVNIIELVRTEKNKTGITAFSFREVFFKIS